MKESEYKYKVCTLCFTFNHAPYIEDAMNGFVMQVTSFPVISIIVDDASTDGAPEVIRNYLAEHFKLPYRTEETEYAHIICAKHKTNDNCEFVVFLLKYNHYSIKKSKFPYLSEWLDNAKYHALCEGDDYWINPNKLQFQIDYLEGHSECGLVHARAKIFNQQELRFRGCCGDNVIQFSDIIIRNPVVTLTTCFRASLFKEYMKCKTSWATSDWKMGDYPLWIWLSHCSEVHFLNEEVAVYRELDYSMSHVKKIEDKIAFIESTKEIQLFFADLFLLEEEIKKKIQYNADFKCAIACYQFKERKVARPYLKRLTFKDKWRIMLMR